MTYIEQLLNGENVEWKKLGEVCEIKGRIGFRGYTRRDLVEKGEGAITISPSNIINQQLSFESCSYISWMKYEESPEIEVEVNDVIFTKTASVGKTALVKNLPQEATINPQLVLLKNIKCTPAYLAYVLQNDDFQHSIKKITGQGSVPNVSQSALAKILIPLPPLSVQHRIVEILDKFTELEAELEANLEAELDCRKRQYEYYRNQLLSFDMLNREEQKLNDVKIVKLKDVCTLTRGKRLTKRDLDINGIYPVYHGGIEPIGYYNQSNRKANSTMIINVGASAGTVGYSANDFWSSDGCFCFSHNEQLNQRYLYYSLQNIETFIKSKVRKAGIPTLDNKVLENIPIPLPSLSVQREIVEILDKFDTLCNSISEGLPKEIELRRKQYEYYRNQLLTFAQ